MYKTCCFTVYYNFCKTFTSSENGNVNLPKQKCKAYSSGIQKDQGFCLEKPQNKGRQRRWASWAVWRRGRHLRTVSAGMYVDHIASLPPHQRVNSRASLWRRRLAAQFPPSFTFAIYRISGLKAERNGLIFKGI